MSPITKILNRYFWLIGLIPIYLYFKSVFIYSQNIPHWDDYAIIDFVNRFNNSDSFFEKINLIFAQHNEHRIAFTRLIALLIYKLNGSLNFQWFIWFGNFGLVGILIVFYKFLTKIDFSINYLVPICFIIFQFSLYENTFWGMASVQNFWVVFFVLMAFWQISVQKIPYFWAFMAAFTSANGVLFVPIIGVISFLYFKNYKQLIKFSILGLLILACYFLLYQKPPNTQPVSIDFLKNIKATFMLLGSVFDLFPNMIFEKKEFFSMFFGGILLAVSLFVLFRNYLISKELRITHKFDFVFLASILLFVLGTCFLTSLARLQYGFYVFLTSKYKIYSILALCSVYLILLVNFKYFGKRFVLIFFTFIAACVNFLSNYNAIGEIKNYKKSEIASFYNGWHNGKSDVPEASKSCYKYENTIFDSIIKEDSTIIKPVLGKVFLTDNNVIVTNLEYLLHGNSPENGAYLEFISADNRYIFATQQEKMNSKKAYLLARKPFYSLGFSAEIPLPELPTGDYFINILDKTDSGIKRINTNYYIEIEGVTTKKIIQNWEKKI